MTDRIQQIYYSSAASIDEGTGASVHSRGICFGLAKLSEVVPLVAYTEERTRNRIEQNGMPTRFLVRTKMSKDGTVGVWKRVRYTTILSFYLLKILFTEDTTGSVFYLRWAYFFFPLVALLIIFRANYFLEENARDEPEQLSLGRNYRARISAILENIAVTHARGVVCNTDEVRQSICKRHKYPFEKTSVVPNGVEPNITKANSPSQDLRSQLGLKENSEFLIGFMGSGNYPWHGIDEMCHLVNSLNDQTVHLVLFGPNLLQKSMPGVHFMGYVGEDKLFSWLQCLDLAFGTMNLKAKGLTQNCPIKVGIYLDAGLPVVLNYDDVRLTGEEPFVLNLSTIDRTQWSFHFKGFVDYVRTKKEGLRQAAQEFARTRISWDMMAKSTFDFILSRMNSGKS